MDEIRGTYSILFYPYPQPKDIDIAYAVRDSRGDILWLQAEDGTIYNWKYVLMMKKITKGEK